MEPDPATSASERVLAEERAFVLALGGYSLEISGASLVTHEKLPVPRFNFGLVRNVGRERQAAFFERALDHYFQRALRPTFRVADPPPEHLDRGWRRFAFRPTSEPLTLLAAPPGLEGGSLAPVEVSEVGPEELDRIVAFWAGSREREELARSIEVLVHHPNRGERLVPLIATRHGAPVSAALVYALGGTAGIHGVATDRKARGAGAATAIVRHALAHSIPRTADLVGMIADHPRIARRLETIGFREVGRLVEYALPPDAELALPPPGPPTPPRWRPPRDRGERPADG